MQNTEAHGPGSVSAHLQRALCAAQDCVLVAGVGAQSLLGVRVECDYHCITRKLDDIAAIAVDNINYLHDDWSANTAPLYTVDQISGSKI